MLRLISKPLPRTMRTGCVCTLFQLILFRNRGRIFAPDSIDQATFTHLWIFTRGLLGMLWLRLVSFFLNFCLMKWKFPSTDRWNWSFTMCIIYDESPSERSTRFDTIVVLHSTVQIYDFHLYCTSILIFDALSCTHIMSSSQLARWLNW